MIPAKVDQLFLSNVGFVVVLKGDSDERSLPIFIGAAEAQVIALWMNKIKVPRPLTHDLLKNILDCMETRLMKIEVCDLRKGTFYANLVMMHDGAEMRMDSRPSDAIALALRCEAPIYVAEKVMEEAGRVLKETEEEPGKGASVQNKANAQPGGEDRPLTPLEQLERDLARAVKDERYEDAAGLRDEIKHLKDSHTEN